MEIAATHSADELEELGSRQRHIGDSFGLASWIAIIGVLLAWWYIKLDEPMTETSGAPIASVLSTPLRHSPSEEQELIQLADTAFAAGDVVEPEGDNALHYYQLILEQTPDDAEAQRGIRQVTDYLLHEAESALSDSDWNLARNDAARVLDIHPNHRKARTLRSRAAQGKRIAQLLDRAVSLYASGKLTLPTGDNAAAVYQAVLELDADNDAAQQGLDSIVQRTIANAESAMFAGNAESAKQYLARASAINPNAAGIASLEQTEKNLQAQQTDRDIQNDLREAAEALQAERFMLPAEPNAFSLYQRVLERDPDSEAAQRGLQLVRDGLLDRARTLLAARDMESTFYHLDAAEQAGANALIINDLRNEAAYQQRLLDAAAGRFDGFYPSAELTVVRKQPPTYPRTAPSGASGSVEMHVTVTQSGEVRDIEVQGTPEDYFKNAAIRAVSRWKFKPVMDNGRPVPVRTVVRLKFQG